MSRVLITGCSTGIGRPTAVALADRGSEVVGTARRPESLVGALDGGGVQGVASVQDVDEHRPFTW